MYAMRSSRYQGLSTMSCCVLPLLSALILCLLLAWVGPQPALGTAAAASSSSQRVAIRAGASSPLRWAPARVVRGTSGVGTAFHVRESRWKPSSRYGKRGPLGDAVVGELPNTPDMAHVFFG